MMPEVTKIRSEVVRWEACNRGDKESVANALIQECKEIVEVEGHELHPFEDMDVRFTDAHSDFFVQNRVAVIVTCPILITVEQWVVGKIRDTLNLKREYRQMLLSAYEQNPRDQAQINSLTESSTSYRKRFDEQMTELRKVRSGESVD